MLIAMSLLGYTVAVAVNNPVNMENLFLDDYKSVDKNYEKILADNKEFDAHVDFTYKFTDIENNKYLHLNFVSDKYLTFKTIATLTRPHTNKYNQSLSISSSTDNSHIFNMPNLLKGKWRIIIKIQTSDLTAYKNIDFTQHE